MDKQTKTKIKNLALALRDDLEKEIENRLNNIGVYPDKEWKDGRSLTHLSKDEIENRKRNPKISCEEQQEYFLKFWMKNINRSPLVSKINII